jgi:hypothetical protein
LSAGGVFCHNDSHLRAISPAGRLLVLGTGDCENGAKSPEASGGLY